MAWTFIRQVSSLQGPQVGSLGTAHASFLLLGGIVDSSLGEAFCLWHHGEFLLGMAPSKF